MSRYRFSYQSIDRYDAMVTHYQFMLRCTPCDAAFQRLEEHQLHLLAAARVSRGEDCFGNIIHYGMMRARHDIFVVGSSGVVECGAYRIGEREPNSLFARHTPLTLTDGAIVEFACGAGRGEGSHLDRALRIADAIYSYMNYTPGATSVTTSAVETFASRRGVCQDYSHLMLAICRAEGITSRYVVGYVEGTGESHAWCEVWSEGVWWGIDPTHNRLIERGYIKVSHGRDASDCSIVRGMRRGVAEHTSLIRVIVEEE